MEAAFSAFVKTATEYGQALPELAATDNPLRDLNWLLNTIPSLQETQDKLDHITGIVGKGTTNQTETPQPNRTPGTAQPEQMVASTVSDVASSAEDIGRTGQSTGSFST
jgi:hypothetical protein